MQKTVEQLIQDTVAGHDMLPAQPAPAVLMVSGGSDSVALARLLPALYPQVPFTVLHVNHGLRGEDADKDGRFVTHLAHSLGLPCEVVRVDVAGLAAARGAAGNVEDVGRRERYAAAAALLDRLCQDAGCSASDGRIVTAHTLDDRVETFLMRLVVGAGTTGLASIPHVNGRTIRPLLSCTRQQLRDHITTCHPAPVSKEDKVSACHPALPLWREDASNNDTTRLRAFVRHEVVPLMTAKNPDFVRTMERTIDVLFEEDAYLREEASMLVGDTDEDGPLTLEAALLAKPLVLARRIVYEACNRAIARLAPGARITQEHIDAIVMGGGQRGFALHLPGGIEVRNDSGLLTFSKAAPPRQYH